MNRKGEDQLRALEDAADRIEELLDRIRQQDRYIDNILRHVNRQAEDEGLWFNAITITEAYLQRSLRELHATVEGETIEWRDSLENSPSTR